MPDILHALLGAIKELPPHRWRCTVDGITEVPVTEHKVGLEEGATAWTRFRFDQDGTPHDLRIERNVAGTTAIMLDGEAMPHPSIDIHPDTCGLQMVLVVKARFVQHGLMREIRFDGRMWP